MVSVPPLFWRQVAVGIVVLVPWMLVTGWLVDDFVVGLVVMMVGAAVATVVGHLLVGRHRRR